MHLRSTTRVQDLEIQDFIVRLWFPPEILGPMLHRINSNISFEFDPISEKKFFAFIKVYLYLVVYGISAAVYFDEERQSPFISVGRIFYDQSSRLQTNIIGDENK